MTTSAENMSVDELTGEKKRARSSYVVHSRKDLSEDSSRRRVRCEVVNRHSNSNTGRTSLAGNERVLSSQEFHINAAVRALTPMTMNNVGKACIILVSKKSE